MAENHLTTVASSVHVQFHTCRLFSKFADDSLKKFLSKTRDSETFVVREIKGYCHVHKKLKSPSFTQKMCHGNMT